MIFNDLSVLLTQKSQLAYAKRLKYTGFFALCLGGLFLLLAFDVRLTSFAQGMLVGLGSSSLLLGVRAFQIAFNPQRLRASYIKAYDERHQVVIKLAAVSTLILLVVLIIGCLCLNVFWGLVLGFRVFLEICLYTILLSFLGIKRLLEHVI
ncbi:DNA-binding protein [Streptococcus equi]|uniref:DNA-binding protein n=1 Tax=Streptococcus equi TaxID=1336 RepID=UPI002658ADBD|nr:DNA-binding protein [Streptococcus equi]WKF66400.1 DNA-binding protein [Streptococcus equi subsp. zooepidemicus]